MDRQSLFHKNVTFNLRFLFIFILGLICGLSSPGTPRADELSLGGIEKTISTPTGKKTAAEIKKYVQQIRQQKEAGIDDNIATRWLKQGHTDKYAPQKTFVYSLQTSKQLIDDLQKNIAQGEDIQSEVEELLKKRKAVQDADAALQIKFAEIRQKCLEQGFSDVILKRHQKMKENHDTNLQALYRSFDELERLATQKNSENIQHAIRILKEQLDKYTIIPDPPLLNTELAHGIQYIEAPTLQENEIPLLEPNNPAEEEEKVIPATERTLPAGISAQDEGLITPMAVTGPPTSEDLSPTIDVQITPEIIALAASLDNEPLKIYDYVTNNFDFEPYLGSRKGSAETLNQKSGNDYDQCSLLIALLRASNIPARYVRGIVELPVDQVKNWLGVDDCATAGSILTTVGMEGVNIVDGEGTVVTVQFRHVWVEAYLPYTNYRGVPVDDSGKMWVPMDPSIKEYRYQNGIDIPSEMGFDAEIFIDNYITTYHEKSPTELYIEQINNYREINYPDYDYEDIVRTRTISSEELEIIPGSLPFTVRTVDSDFAEIPADKRYTVRFRLYDSSTTFIDYTANLPDIAGKRVTISYIAATQADQDVIDSYGDLYETPPYLVNLKPVLKIDGNDVAVGLGSIGMGLTHNSDMHFTMPTGENNEMPVVSNSIIAGTYQAIGIDSGRINPDIFMPSASESTPSTDDWTGEKLWKTAMGYLDRIERNDAEVARTMQMVVTKDVSEAIVENTILVTSSFGTPQTFEWKGLVVDADRCIVGPFAVNGDSSKQKPFMVLSGADGSTSENRIFEDMYDEEAVSTIKILELSSDMGIPVYTFNSGNIGSIYSSLNLSSSVESAIYNAVASGRQVTVPRDNITYSEWYGTGYISMDPATGAAGYIISGGHNGGATVDIWVAWKLFWFTIFRDLCDSNPITADITFPLANSYFPALDWGDFRGSNQLRFDVTYNICYKDAGTKTVYESFKPHYPYPPGNYTFYAGSGTGESLDYTMFGVEIETPDGEKAIAGCDSITLDTKFTPSAPPSVNYQWGTSWTLGCLLGCGDGTFTPDNTASTEFQGTDKGGLTAQVEASNTYGTTKGKKELKVIGVKNIKAEDSEDGSNFVEDTDKGVEAEIQTIYVARSDTGTVNISVETEPTVAEADLPFGWQLEKESGTLRLESTSGKLSAVVRKRIAGDIVVKLTKCLGDGDHFQLKIVIVNIDFLRDTNSNYGFDPFVDATVEYKQVATKNGGNTSVLVDIDGVAPEKVFFKSNTPGIEVSQHASGSPLAISITGKGEYEMLDNGTITAHLGDEDGTVGANLTAYSYNEKSIEYQYFRIEDSTSAGTQTAGTFSTALLLDTPNKWLRQAVLSFTLNGTNTAVDKSYDFYPLTGTTPTHDGKLEFDSNEEQDIITTGYTSGARIFFYVHEIKGAATGYSLGSWVFLSDDGNFRTAAHEVGHQFGYSHVPDTDSENLMYRFKSSTKWKLYNHPYSPWDNDGPISGATKKRQWNEVH